MGLRNLFLACVLSCVTSAMAQPTAPVSSSLIHFPDGADRVVVPLETAATLLVAKLNMDGHEGWFIIDTGTTYTTVDQETAERWKLAPVAKSQPAGQPVALRLFRARRIECGKAQFAPQMIVGADLHQMSSFLQFPVAGILGNDLIGEVPFEIDYRKKSLTMYVPARFSAPVAGHAIPLRFINGNPFAQISVEEYPVEAVIDTGGMGGGTLGPLPLLGHPQLLEGKPNWRTSSLQLSGKRDDNFDCRFDPVSLLGREPRAVWFLCSREYNDKMDTITNATIGAAQLADGSFVFDYRHHRMWAYWPPRETTEEMLARLGDASGHDLAGVTPLMRAASAGRADVALKLLDRGAKVEAQNSISETALSDAVVADSPEVVRLLLAHGARTDGSTSVGGETALHFACEQIDVDIVKQLLKAGADPNAADTHGWTPLKRAAEGNQLEMAEALLAAGADPIAVDKEGYTPLIIAARRSGPALVKAMLDKLGARAPVAAGTAMEFVAYDGRVENMKLLLDRGADPNFADDEGSTPLMRAIQDDSGAATLLLLSRGADPSCRNHDGKTAWDLAAMYNNIPVLRALQNPPAAKDNHR